MMGDELLPCPFCGGESVIQCDEMHTAYGATGIKEARAICEDCGASSAYCTTRGGALALWNSRVYSVTGDERGDTTVIADETLNLTVTPLEPDDKEEELYDDN